MQPHTEPPIEQAMDTHQTQEQTSCFSKALLALLLTAAALLTRLTVRSCQTRHSQMLVTAANLRAGTDRITALVLTYFMLLGGMRSLVKI